MEENIMKKRFLGTGVLVLAAGVLCSCGTTSSLAPSTNSETEAQAQIVETYIGTHSIDITSTNEYEGQTYETTTTWYYYEQLQLLDDGTYDMTQTQKSDNAYYVIFAKGTFEKEAKDAKYDGYTEVVLDNATYVQSNQDIYNHMFSLSIDSETSTFPHEIPGGDTVTKDEFLAAYGVFGSRFILHPAVESDTSVTNWIDVEADVQVVE